MGNAHRRVIAHELLNGLKSYASEDWRHRAPARARMRVLVKRILRKHGYSPNLQDAAVQTVPQQAEVVSAPWAALQIHVSILLRRSQPVPIQNLVCRLYERGWFARREQGEKPARPAPRLAGSALCRTRRDELPDPFDFGAETVKSHGTEALLQQPAQRNGLLIGEFFVKSECGNHEILPLREIQRVV